MDWLKKLLEAAQIKDGKLDVEALMTTVNTEFPKNAVPKEAYNNLSEAKKKLETDISDRDKQLEDLSKTAGASEDLKKQIAQLQNDNKTAADKYAADLKDLTLSNAIKSALNGKVHDESLVAGLFDKEKLVVDGDKIVGLEEQISSLQESKAFLFKSDDSQQQQNGFQKIGGNGQGTGQASNEQLANIFGNTKQ